MQENPPTVVCRGRVHCCAVHRRIRANRCARCLSRLFRSAHHRKHPKPLSQTKWHQCQQCTSLEIAPNVGLHIPDTTTAISNSIAGSSKLWCSILMANLWMFFDSTSDKLSSATANFFTVSFVPSVEGALPSVKLSSSMHSCTPGVWLPPVGTIGEFHCSSTRTCPVSPSPAENLLH